MLSEALVVLLAFALVGNASALLTLHKVLRDMAWERSELQRLREILVSTIADLRAK